MTPFEVEVDVPESREVTVTLPTEVPTGRVRMMVAAAEDVPTTTTYYRPADPAVAAEFDEFLRLLPVLRPTHGGHYVAVRQGQVVASGLYLDPVLRLARAAVADAPFYCGWVEPVGGYEFRSGLVMVAEPVARS